MVDSRSARRSLAFVLSSSALMTANPHQHAQRNQKDAAPTQVSFSCGGGRDSLGFAAGVLPRRADGFTTGDVTTGLVVGSSGS